MMEGSIQKEIERGEKALKASRLLLEQGLYEDTVSRAYYAVLHLAKAALLSQGVRTSSHKGIITQFGLHLVKKGLVDQELAKILAKGRGYKGLQVCQLAGVSSGAVGWPWSNWIGCDISSLLIDKKGSKGTSLSRRSSKPPIYRNRFLFWVFNKTNQTN